MTTVAGAKVAAVHSFVSVGDATQVGTDTQRNQPLFALHSLNVLLRVSHRRDYSVVCFCRVDHVGSAPTDKHWLASELDNDIVTRLDRGEVDIHDTCGSNTSVGPEEVDNFSDGTANEYCTYYAKHGGAEVVKGSTICVTNG